MKNIRKEFTDCINEANLIVRKYRVLAPKCKELISKYHGVLANQCYFSLGNDPYFSITFKENTAPDNFYCECEKLDLRVEPRDKSYGFWVLIYLKDKVKLPDES